MKEIKPIKTESDYQEALAEIEKLMAAEANTPEDDRLDLLTTLVNAYEDSHFPIELPDAVEAIKFRMEQQGLTPNDLVPYIGRINRVYEVLNRRRGLSINMIRKLHTGLNIPADALLYGIIY